jgi:methanogenic corrinoid protein MtbC1
MTLNEEIREAIIEWDEDKLVELCQSSLKNKVATPEEILKIIGSTMEYIGELFEEEEIFLPDLIGSAEIVKKVVDEILDPAIKEKGGERVSKGKVVLGTVEGDVHSIGKDLVASFLFSNGYEIYNLGEEVPPSKFIEKSEEVGAKLIGLSSLLTMSMDSQRQVVEELNNKGIRGKYIVIVGGSPTSEDWAQEIGADGWADDAVGAVSLVKKLLDL